MTSEGSVSTEQREAVVGKLRALHSGEETVYTGCRINCGASQCILKARVKDGVVTAIEPDDHYNPGVGREDAVVSDLDLVKNRLQLRGCPMAWTWHKLAYSPERILYPMKRVDGAKRGEGRFERISWDEALDLVARRFGEIKAEHGPDAMATLSSAKCTNEENYLIQKFTRAVLGTNSVDHCARL